MAIPEIATLPCGCHVEQMLDAEGHGTRSKTLCIPHALEVLDALYRNDQSALAAIALPLGMKGL